MVLAAVLFDFDGTLVDTRTASWPLFEQTNRKFGLGIDTRRQFFALFEHNLYEGLVRHCGDTDRGAAAAQHFMQLVGEHYDPPFVPGIDALVRGLSVELALAIVSSNTRATIARLLARDGLDKCFDAILAGDVEPSKTRAIAGFLGEDRRGYDADEVVLVTDTSGDVEEARRAGIAAYGVSWGMHERGRLLDAGAVAVADHPDELHQWFINQNKKSEGDASCRAAP